ncbi:unnamed protein product [Candida verbasci]|uniref:PIH1 N-terminal domain-containing protein n=1 Tax=Candida verbasci TaxID=1227364 RepID=A0A9W4TTG0_9ASCO|nr:unnamed protein product [Candida verbasci]
MVLPTPGFVVKTRTDCKVFINICHSPNVPKPEDFNPETSFNLIIENKWQIPIVVSEEKSTFDKKGIPSLAYDCCINSECFKWIQSNQDLKQILIEWSIESIELTYKLQLDRSYSIPKMLSKGELSEIKEKIPEKLIYEEEKLPDLIPQVQKKTIINETPWEYSVNIKNLTTKKCIIIDSNKPIPRFTYYKNCIHFNNVEIPVVKSTFKCFIKGIKDLKKSVKDIRDNEGLAAQYGITFDDSKYDYMQHLKPMGEGTFVPVEGKTTIEDLFPNNIPSKNKVKMSRDLNQGIPEELKGFNPDLDPRIREVLEALEDEAYIGSDEELDNLIKSGQAEEEDEYDEWDMDNFDDDYEDEWAHVRNNKQNYDSDEFDDVASLPEFDKKGKKANGSITSMSSSALYRTEGLSLLDDRYEQLNKQYQEEPKENYKPFDMKEERNDFEGMLDEFLETYELESGGRKLAKKDNEKTKIKLAASSVSKGKDAKKISDKFKQLNLN